MQSWVIKYIPKSLKDLQGQDKAVSELKDFVTNYNKQSRKALLLHGPSGCGKTSSIHALANELDLELIEFNASDIRNKVSIEDVVGSSLKQQSLFAKSKLILLDEIDGLSGNKDRGGASALTNLMKDSKFPIIMTANDAYKKSLSSLRSKCLVVSMHALNYLTVFNILKKVCENENIKFDDSVLKTLARRSSGDLRGAITDLQTSSSLGNLTIKEVDELSERQKVESMPNALIKVLKSSDPLVARTAFDNVREDLDESMLWLEENIPKEYEGQDLNRAFDCLSRADVFKGRIRRWQYWRFLVYINDLITAGVAVSKDEKYKKFISYTPTTRIFKLWRAKQSNAKRNSIAEKVAIKTHSSKKDTIKNTIPYLKEMCRNKEFKIGFEQEFDLDKDELAWLCS